jgi:hypothetical protein
MIESIADVNVREAIRFVLRCVGAELVRHADMSESEYQRHLPSYPMDAAFLVRALCRAFAFKEAIPRILDGETEEEIFRDGLFPGPKKEL